MTEETMNDPGSDQQPRLGASSGALPTSDSAVFQHTFYGILNDVGQFWTPLAFASEHTARCYIQDFSTGVLGDFSMHRIVPVRIQLEALEISPPSPSSTDGGNGGGGEGET